MRKIFIVFGVFFMFVFCKKSSEKENPLEIDHYEKKWVTVISEEGNFKIDFPTSKYSKKTKIELTQGERINIYKHKLVLQNYNPIFNLGYVIDYSYHPHLDKEEYINEYLDSYRDNVLSAYNGKLEYEFVLDSADVYGRELFYSIDSADVRVRSRVFFKDSTSYRLMVLTEEGKLFNNSSVKFFDSFQILD